MVTLQGDTIKGYIDYKEWNSSPSEITFKPSAATDNTKQYGVNDIRYFEILNNEAYQRFEVNISLDPVGLEHIRFRDTSNQNNTVFLKVIYSGTRLSLYSYTDKIKERFFILEAGHKQPVELSYREYLTADSRSKTEEDNYRDQLRTLMFNLSVSNNVAYKIQKARYAENDLKKIVYVLNGVSDQEVKRMESEKATRTRFFVGVGLQRNQVSIEGNHFLTNYATNTSSVVPIITAGIDLFVNPNVRKLFLELNYLISLVKQILPGPGQIVLLTPMTLECQHLQYSPNLFLVCIMRTI